MKNTFTEELLLKYLYHETSPAETKAVETALDTDWRLREQYEALEMANRNLPKVTFSPKQSTLQNILKYSSGQPAIEPYV